MGSKVIKVIRPVDNSAEKEYLKEFLRFIGCFFSDCPVETRILSNWDKALFPENEPGSVDLVLNFFGEDPFAAECRNLNVKRIYCYFDFDDEKMWGELTIRPLLDESKCKIINDKTVCRSSVLIQLINQIWDDEPSVCRNVCQIAKAYLENTQGDMFQLLQAENCLRVLTMGEVLKEPTAQVSKIKMDSYIHKILKALLELRESLESQNDSYSCYAKANASLIMNNIESKLYDGDRVKLRSTENGERIFKLSQSDQVKRELCEIVNADPEFLTAYLLLATCCRSKVAADRATEWCYQQILKAVPGNKKRCAFIWYRVGQYYEKKYFDARQALGFYRKAVETDPRFYQALFKLGYYAASEGRFEEAEMWLNKTIQSIFCGRSTEPSETGEYENWLSLSMKNSQYAYKAYMLLAKISVNSDREYSARSFVGRACMAATRFEEATLVRHALKKDEFIPFSQYHKYSVPVWAMWQVLKPWSENIIRDYYIRDIVRERLSRWVW